MWTSSTPRPRPWRPKVTGMWIWTLVAFCALTGVASGPVLQALPDPPPDSADGKPPYASLATRRFALAVAIGAAGAGLLIAVRLPAASWPVWLPLATVGVLLAAIDARTTWLPLPLTRVLWLGTAVGAGLQVVLAPASERSPLAVRIIVGAAVVGIFFGAFWWLAGGLGFGDVRLAPVLGAALASVSWEAVAVGLFLGTALGALFGAVRHVRRRAGPFPYGPALVAGTFLGLGIVG